MATLLGLGGGVQSCPGPAGLCCVKNESFYGQSWWQARKITASPYNSVYEERKE